MNGVSVLRILATLVVVAVAAIVGWQLWDYYMDSPWTRDGRVRADVVQVTPDVSGLVTNVLVRENETVRAGDVLFVIDQSRYKIALAHAEATAASDKAAMAYAEADMRRQQSVSSGAVSKDQQQLSASKSAQAQAAYAVAQSAVDLAELDLSRTVVRASVDGTISNFSMRPGDYAVAGHAAFALVDSDSLYVDGYFEETKLGRIHVGDKARVQLMSGGVIAGHVQSIAAGIADQERAPSATLLADINPTFNWVRLASRVPVRIAIDRVPKDVALVAGLTATVSIRAP